MRKLLIVGITALFTAAAFAAEVGGVKLADKVAVGGQELVLNGAGIRSRAIFKVYVGSLYLPAKAGDLAGVLAKGPRRIQMNLLRDLSADQLVDALNDGLRDNNSEAELAAVKAQQTQLATIMKAFGEVKEGNVVTLDFVDDGYGDRLQRRREGSHSGRGVQPRADPDLAGGKAGTGRPQEGDAGRLIGVTSACGISGRPAATGC